ncbi:MAG: N-acetylmuramoyl-L-alanine amidase [Aurantimicrobium sp.]|uniref:N-acetylmuramoyl-L-alanine amidase n=1 Tax=Aurantimicrobium sp. TaxID=1930784 RepID=UPI002FC90C80
MEKLAPRKKTDYLVVHCSATKPSQDIGVAEITNNHLEQGWTTIGYHFVIRRNGQVEDGRDMFSIGAHVFGWNTVTLGICLIGGVKEEDGVTGEVNYTNEQIASLIGLLVKLKRQWPQAEICGHHDFPGVTKECPCFDVKEWVKTIPELNKQKQPDASDVWIANLFKEKFGEVKEHWVSDCLTDEIKQVIYENKLGIIVDEYGPGEVGHVEGNLLALPISEKLLKSSKCYAFENGIFENYFISDIRSYKIEEATDTTPKRYILTTDTGSVIKYDNQGVIYVQFKPGEVKLGKDNYVKQ